MSLSHFFLFSPHLPPSLIIIPIFPDHHFLLQTTSEHPQGQVEEGYPRHTPLSSNLPTFDPLSSWLAWDSKAHLTSRDEIPCAAITAEQEAPNLVAPSPSRIRLDLFLQVYWLFCLPRCLRLSHWRCVFMNCKQYPFRHKAKHTVLCN